MLIKLFQRPNGEVHDGILTTILMTWSVVCILQLAMPFVCSKGLSLTETLNWLGALPELTILNHKDQLIVDVHHLVED